MSRDDLLATNAKIVGSVAEQIKQTSPDAVMIVVSNPLDAMVQRRLASDRFSTKAASWARPEFWIPRVIGPFWQWS